MVILDRGRLLGIDHGARVIGLAVCDPTWVVARPYGLLRRTTREADFTKIAAAIATEHITAIVLGMPDMPEDFDGVSQASTVRRWGTRLAAAIQLPIYPWNEMLSTFTVESIAEELDEVLPDRIDDRAAAVILQSFIDAHPVGTPLPEPLNRKRG
jgi:putative Holliday junction resolvase